MELTNGLVRFLFDDSTGSLRQITDLTSGRDHLGDPAGARLFRLIIPTPEELARPAESHTAGKPRMERSGDRLTMRFQDVNAGGRPTGVSAKVEVRLPPDSPEAFFSIEVANNGPDMLHEVHFPWVGGWTGIAGAGVDAMTVGMFSIDPHKDFPTRRCHAFGGHNRRRYYRYLYLPFVTDISGGGRGLSYCTYAEQARIGGVLVESLSLHHDRTCLSWAYRSMPFLKAGQTWRSPEVGVGVHQGDWHDSADRYRRFLQGRWSPPPVTPRLANSIGFHNIQFKGFYGEEYHDFRETAAIARDGMKYGIDDLCLWDLIAQTYMRPDDGGFWQDTPERLEALRAGLAEAKRLGCNTSTLVNFRLITEKCRQFPELYPLLQRSIYGKTINESYCPDRYHGSFLNYGLDPGGHVICQSSPEFERFALNVVTRTLDLGFTSLFVDQATDWWPCFDEAHGHDTPGDTMERAHAWSRKAAEIIRSRNPEGYVIGELPENFNTQIFELWWDWFRRDFKSEVIRYVLPESLQLWIVDENERDVMGKAFATGHVFATMTREMTGLLSDEPEFAEHIARLGRLRAGTMDFLGRGRFMDTCGLQVDGGHAYSYTSAAGLAVALANGEDKACTVNVQLSPDALGRAPSGGGLLHAEDGSVMEVTPARKGGALNLEVPLPPYASAVWCLPYGKKEKSP